MAIIAYISPTQPTESTDGFTPYKNGGQIALRSRAYPKRVTSSRAQSVRNIISQLSIFWESPLSNADRIGWGNYAFGTALTNAWNQPRYIKGYAHYMRSNRPRLQFGLPRIDTPPSTLGLPTANVYAFRMNNPPSQVKVFFKASDAWVTENGAYLMIWQGYQTKPTIGRPTETYLPLAYIAGSASTPPTPPVTITPLLQLSSSPARIWFRWSLSRNDGRLSL